MSKTIIKPGTLLCPVPVVMVTCGKDDTANIITVAWTGIIASDPATTYVSIRKERHSYDIIKNSGEFCINLTTEALAYATDFAGVKSGKNIDKFEALHLTKEPCSKLACPMIKESPVCLECRVKEIKEMGSHDMFIAEIVAVQLDDNFIDETNRYHLDECQFITYSHGEYFKIGEKIGKFGYSVKKK